MSLSSKKGRALRRHGASPAVEELPPLGPNEFRCDACRGVFGRGWSEAEARAEHAELFGHLGPHEEAQVCDDCFNEIMAASASGEA